MTDKEHLKNTGWEGFQHLSERHEVPKKTILLGEGEISQRLYFIEEGCIRMFFTNNGKDISFQFFMEGQYVSSIESFRTNEPSLFAIECIEPSIVHSISKDDFNHTLSEHPEVRHQMEEIIFQRLLFYQKLFLSRIKDNPEKRYLDLLENNPEILLRIPQHYIASFLGITSVSLSRIRNR